MSRRVLTVAALLLFMLLVPVVPATAGPRVPAKATRGPWLSRGVDVLPAPARFGIARHDGNDVRGALDLRSMKIARGRSKDSIGFSTYEVVSNAAIDSGTGNFAVLIDINDDRRYDFGQYVFFAAGRIRGVLVDLGADRIVDRTALASRSGPRAFRTAIVRTKIKSPGTYRFALFTYNEGGACSPRRPCVDGIPNRFPLIALDHRAPTVRLDPMAAYAGDVRDDLISPLGFTAADDRFGTGVKRWIVQRRQAGSASSWSTVASGRVRTSTVGVPGSEGLTYDVRVVLIDRQKNRKVSSVVSTSFPLDDRSVEIQYAGTTTQSAPTGAFLDTITSLEVGATATATFTGSADVCVMGGPVGTAMAASADLTIDDVSGGTAVEDDGTARRERVLCVSVGSGAHTVVLTGAGTAAFVLDGLYIAR